MPWNRASVEAGYLIKVSDSRISAQERPCTSARSAGSCWCTHWRRERRIKLHAVLLSRPPQEDKYIWYLLYIPVHFSAALRQDQAGLVRRATQLSLERCRVTCTLSFQVMRIFLTASSVLHRMYVLHP